MRTVNDARVNVFPLVTAWLELSDPVARSSLEPLVIAQCVAVPVPVTVPSVICGTVTWRPVGLPAAGAPILRLVLLPSV